MACLGSPGSDARKDGMPDSSHLESYSSLHGWMQVDLYDGFSDIPHPTATVHKCSHPSALQPYRRLPHSPFRAGRAGKGKQSPRGEQGRGASAPGLYSTATESSFYRRMLEKLNKALLRTFLDERFRFGVSGCCRYKHV